MTSDGPELVLIWYMDTENTGYSGNITEIVFDVVGADPSIELTGALIYDLAVTSLVDNSPTIGTDNIVFSGLDWSITPSTNARLELKVYTASNFTSDNIQFGLQPVNIKMADMASVSGTPIDSGIIGLENPPAGPPVVYVRPNSTGSGDGSSWSNAANLQDALAGAAFGEELWLASGNYYPSAVGDRTVYFNVAMSNLQILGGFSGNGLEVNREERDWVAHPTVLTGDIGSPGIDTDNSQTVLLVGAMNVMIDGLIIEDGYADGSGGLDGNAAGVYASSSAWNFSAFNSVFRNNKVVYSGGGGGAFYQANNRTTADHHTHFENVIFENNSAAHGGAVGTKWSGDFINCVFIGNEALVSTTGGLVYNTGSPGGEVVNCVFHDNSSSDANGAALFADVAATVNVRNSILWNNTATSPNEIQDNGTVNTYNSIVTGADYGTDAGGNGSSDPMFSDNVYPSGADMVWFTPDDGLRILDGSPAANAGVLVSSANIDILGDVRDASPTLGPYETTIVVASPILVGTSLNFSGNLQVSQSGIKVFEFQLDTTTNGASGQVEEVTIDLFHGNLNDFVGFELYDESGVSSVSSVANLMTGNVVFENLSLGLSDGANTILSLKVDTASTFVGDNVEFKVIQQNIQLGAGSVVGSPQNSGLIPLESVGGGFSGPFLVGTPFNFSGNLQENQSNIKVFEFELDTTTNGASGQIDDLAIEFLSGSASDFVGFELYNENGMSSISSSANLVHGNVLFEGLSYGLSGGSNSILSLRVSTVGSFVSDNVEFKLYPEGIVLSSDNVGGGPQNSGLIPLESVVGGFSGPFLVGTPFNFTGNLQENQSNIKVFEFELDTMTNGASGQIDDLAIEFLYGSASDFVSFELYNESGMSSISSSANLVHGNVLFEGISYVHRWFQLDLILARYQQSVVL